MTDDYVLIQLFVDDKTPLPEPVVVNDNGQEIKLRTVGDKWSYLQSHKFGANAQPFYVLIDHEGQPLSESYAFDDDVEHYVKFLKNGIEQFRKGKKTPLFDVSVDMDASIEVNGNKKELHVGTDK